MLKLSLKNLTLWFNYKKLTFKFLIFKNLILTILPLIILPFLHVQWILIFFLFVQCDSLKKKHGLYNTSSWEDHSFRLQTSDDLSKTKNTIKLRNSGLTIFLLLTNQYLNTFWLLTTLRNWKLDVIFIIVDDCKIIVAMSLENFKS